MSDDQKGNEHDSADREYLGDDEPGTGVDEFPEALRVTADERKVLSQPYDYSIDQLVAAVAKGKIRLTEVPYQREYVWDGTRASRLIESLLLDVPIPVCYFAEIADGLWWSSTACNASPRWSDSRETSSASGGCPSWPN